MKESMIFPREEKTEILFQKILEDPWACEKLQETFCNSCLCGEETDELRLSFAATRLTRKAAAPVMAMMYNR